MKKVSLTLILLCGISFQPKAQNLDLQVNKYSQAKRVESFELNNVQRSTLQTIIHNAEIDKQIDAEYESGVIDTFGDLSRKIPYKGSEIINVNLKSSKSGLDNYTLKPIYIAYGGDLKLRRVEFESKNKKIKARLYSFMESDESNSPSTLYYEFIINMNEKEMFIKLSKDWQVISATETQQLKTPSVSGNDTIDVRYGLTEQQLVAASIKSGVSESINGWTVKMPLVRNTMMLINFLSVSRY